MKKMICFGLLMSVILAFTACKKDNNENKDSHENPITGSINIDGTVFTPKKTTGISSTNGIEGYVFSATDNSTTINLETNSKEAGNYTLCSSCKTTAENIFFGNLVMGDNTYNIESGTLKLSLETNGNISLSFSFIGKNNIGETITVSEGSIKNIAVTEVDNSEYLASILKSKVWYITSYKYQDHLNAMFPLREFYNNAIPIRNSQIEPDPCSWSGTTTSPVGIWKSYKITFTDAAIIGNFSYELKEVNYDLTSTENCNLVYKTTSNSINILNTWNYNSSTKKITTSFGEPYEILDGQTEYFEMEYTVVEFNSNRVVLEGKRYYQDELFITNNVILE